jgi:hypothetical protein
MHLILDGDQKIILPDSSELSILVMVQLNRVSSSGTGPSRCCDISLAVIGRPDQAGPNTPQAPRDDAVHFGWTTPGRVEVVSTPTLRR